MGGLYRIVDSELGRAVHASKAMGSTDQKDRTNAYNRASYMRGARMSERVGTLFLLFLVPHFSPAWLPCMQTRMHLHEHLFSFQLPWHTARLLFCSGTTPRRPGSHRRVDAATVCGETERWQLWLTRFRRACRRKERKCRMFFDSERVYAFVDYFTTRATIGASSSCYPSKHEHRSVRTSY